MPTGTLSARWPRRRPGCHLSWTLLAAIGQVESDNGRYGGAVVLANGDTSPHILGPVLNGSRRRGRDPRHGRRCATTATRCGTAPSDPCSSSPAPGPGTAPTATATASGIPTTSPTQPLRAANYLCAGGGDLRVESQLRAAVMRYNHSVAYVDLVLRLARAYASGAATVIPNGQPTTHAARPPLVKPGQRHQAADAPARHLPREPARAQGPR